MLPLPKHIGPERGRVFRDRSVAQAYPNRPPYPDELFSLLRRLIIDEPRVVLELGCGPGEISRTLAPQVERIDAVDQAETMIEIGRSLPGGDDPHLRWVHSSAEAFEYESPYALIVTAESIHWMDWPVVFPRMRRSLSPNGRLVIIHNRKHHAEWDAQHLAGMAPRYSTTKDWVPWDLFDALADHELFDVEGRFTTYPVPYEQSVEDYLEFWHSMSGFSRERMGEDANRFDEEMRRYLAPYVRDGMLHYEVTVVAAWGLPRDPTAS